MKRRYIMDLPPIDGIFDKKFAEKLKNNKARLKKILLNFDSTIVFYFIPSPELRGIVAKGEEPLIKDMPDKMKELILSGVGHGIQKKMVYDFLTGKLDKKNTFILSNGEIRVVHQGKSMVHHEPIIKTRDN